MITLLLPFLCSHCINKWAAGLNSRQKKKGNQIFNLLLFEILCHDLLDVQIPGIVNCKLVFSGFILGATPPVLSM
jgi:hypothetical protein